MRDRLHPPELYEQRTVVQAVRLAPRPSDQTDEWRFSQMDRALEHLNDFITALMSIRRNPELLAVGRRDLPPLVLGFGWDLHADGTRSEVEWQGLHDARSAAGGRAGD